jgi:hypothetical protein
MNYHQKYIKYKSKYLNLLRESKEQTGGAIPKSKSGSKYKCDPNKKYLEICNEDPHGTYKSKESCNNDCEIKYINRHLNQAKLRGETTQFNLFILELLKKGIKIYIKGGCVLALKLLKIIYDNSTKQNFDKYFNEFVKLELIKDWDFSSYVEDNSITEEYRNGLDKLAKKYNLVPRAKTFILYQTRRPIHIGDQALFEISVLESDNKLDMELPMSTMKVKINQRNLFHVFMFAKSFFVNKMKNEPFDLDILKHILDDIEFIIPKNKSGLFAVDKLSTGDLKEPLIDFIKEFAKNDINVVQFLVTHLVEPNRLCFRIFKNINKVNKINTYIKENNLENARQSLSFLFDSIKIKNIVETFTEALGSKLYTIYNNNLSNVEEFLTGINLNRIQIHFNEFDCNGKNYIKTIFERLYKELPEGYTSDSKLFKILSFLNKNKLFK